jgi:hypothetical protein
MAVRIDFSTCSFTFDAKPGPDVLKALKAHGFRWQPANKYWIRFRGWAGLPKGFADWIVGQCKGPAPEAQQVDPMGFDLAYEDSCARECGL